MPNSSFDEPDEPRRWWRTAGALLLVAAVLGLFFWTVVRLIGGPTLPARHVAKISLLNEKPPPPPPPPPPEPEPVRPKPREVREVKPQPQAQPEPEALKMEGPAADAPSAFVSGKVENEYDGGEIGGERSKYAAYIARLEEWLQAELGRKNLHSVRVRVYLWLDGSGAIQRYQLEGVDSGTEADRQLRDAMGGLEPFGNAPPAMMPMPAGLQVSIP